MYCVIFLAAILVAFTTPALRSGSVQQQTMDRQDQEGAWKQFLTPLFLDAPPSAAWPALLQNLIPNKVAKFGECRTQKPGRVREDIHYGHPRHVGKVWGKCYFSGFCLKCQRNSHYGLHEPVAHKPGGGCPPVGYYNFHGGSWAVLENSSRRNFLRG